MKLLDQLGLQYLIEKFKERFDLKADITYVDSQDALKADKTYVDSKVQTDVPSNAKFTDTVYTHPTGTNPHGTTKANVGLGSVLNYGISTQAEAQTGTSNAKYMTPLRTKQAIDKFKPTKLSELQNDIGAGAGLKIITSATEPSLETGDQWHKEI